MPIISIRIPQLGEGLQEALLVEFIKNPGDKVERDEPIYVMETDKATTDVESPYSGKLVEWTVEPGTVLSIGAEIGKIVGLSTTPCWRRIQKLDEAGVIRARVAVLDPVQVNTGVTVFVSIKTDQHNLDWLERFHAAVVDLPEVVEFYRMSGEVDYLIRVVVPDIAAYDVFYKKLISRIDITKVSSAFAMEQIKYTTELPLDYMVIDQAKSSED